MGKTINLQDYLEEKKLDELEKDLEHLDFDNPIVVKSLITSLIIAHIEFAKKTSCVLESLTNSTLQIAQLVHSISK